MRISHSYATRWERCARCDHERSVEDQKWGCELGDARAHREDFFHKNE